MSKRSIPALALLAPLAILPLLISSCCTQAQPRFWKVRDGPAKNGPLAYTVDTAAVPTTSLAAIDVRHVDSSGSYILVQRPKMISQMSEGEWKQATSGATYSLNYCPRRQACWAKAKAR